MTDFVMIDNESVLEPNESDVLYHNLKRRRIKNRNNHKLDRLLKENESLKKYNKLLLNYCGLRTDNYIEKNATVLQSHARGWRLRSDKIIFDRSVQLFLNYCRTFLAKKKTKKIVSSILKIQSNARAYIQRKTTIGKAIKIISSMRQEIIEHEVKLLLYKRFSNNI